MIWVGKPSDVLIEMMRRPQEDGGYGVDLPRAIFVGDTLDTDVEFANRSGMRSLLVTSATLLVPSGPFWCLSGHVLSVPFSFLHYGYENILCNPVELLN